MSKVIGIVGTRKRNSEEDFLKCVDLFLEVFEEGDTVVTGDCPVGGDDFAIAISQAYCGDNPKVHEANWDEYGKRAGPIRNTLVANDCDILIALVVRERYKCRGTMDTVKKVMKLNKKVILNETALDLSFFEEFFGV